ncbi:MAG: hypothetical protein Greene101449_74 [Candidatus Peregrinibacteria bacterium Greene1014_49]|nr:MAG: hypothetical protein Greene101449_74 [Candidatus Peregrinibacteria bacterium Greene1014_49]
MHPSRFLRAFITAFVLFLLLDAFWHGGLMADFYNQRLISLNPLLAGAMLGLSPGILFVNAINAVALSYFILTHIQHGRSLADAAWIGALLGFTVVGTVNFLNNTFIPRWDIVLALVDTAWGTASGLVVALAIAATCGEERRRGIFGWLRRS